tara:strand:+ start:3240 stop:3398 length:159 start_codon:yes stop_codon:yes gene_type:complete
MILFVFSCKQKKTDPLSQSTLYYGGDIITMNGDTPQYAEAIVIKDGVSVYKK